MNKEDFLTKKDDVLIKQLVENFNLLDRDEKLKIIGMLEFRIMQINDKQPA